MKESISEVYLGTSWRLLLLLLQGLTPKAFHVYVLHKCSTTQHYSKPQDIQVICPQCKEIGQKTRAGAKAVREILGGRTCRPELAGMAKPGHQVGHQGQELEATTSQPLRLLSHPDLNLPFALTLSLRIASYFLGIFLAYKCTVLYTAITYQSPGSYSSCLHC